MVTGVGGGHVRHQLGEVHEGAAGELLVTGGPEGRELLPLRDELPDGAEPEVGVVTQGAAEVQLVGVGRILQRHVRISMLRNFFLVTQEENVPLYFFFPIFMASTNLGTIALLRKCCFLLC